MDVIRNHGNNSAVVYSLLLVLLVLWAGGVVSHYCLDGLEAPVTIHFDNLNGHVEHEEASGHMDFEKMTLADNILTKVFNLDFAIVLSLLYLFLLPVLKAEVEFQLTSSRAIASPQIILPPLRAPPFTA